MIARNSNSNTAEYRSIWISDLHLGTRYSQAEPLLRFLRDTQSEYLYLVGDMIDGWRLKRSWFWQQSYNDIIQKFLRKARKGTRVIYIPGNHDHFARAYAGMHFGGIELMDRTVHTTADGRKLLVLHGDEFDGIVTHARGLARLGGWAYEVSISLNRWVNIARQALGMPYWSLSAALKHKVKKALMFIDNFEQAVTLEAQRCQAQGVICGHIHRADIKEVNGMLYCNTGDWVESCTALVEHLDGRLELLTMDPFHGHPRETLPENDINTHRAFARKLGNETASVPA